jgi:hypothetical protein
VYPTSAEEFFDITVAEKRKYNQTAWAIISLG